MWGFSTYVSTLFLYFIYGMLLVVFIKRLDTWLMELAVVSVLGADRVGIVAGIASVLARHNANIVDIAQTVVQNIFSMIMVVDISKADVDIAQLRRELEEEGRRLGVMVAVYHIDVFRYMQRI